MSKRRLWVGGSVALGTAAVAASLWTSAGNLQPKLLAASHRSTSVSSGPAWGSETLAAVAESIAAGAHEDHPTSARYFVSRPVKGNLAKSGAHTDHGSMPMDVVVMQGSFSNPKWSTAPAGAPPESGNTLVVIVDARNGSVIDMGMLDESPSSAATMLSKLEMLSPSRPLSVVPRR
ncbi:hypothetical protein [Sulfobacillus harzensis]|uniref:Uncharacterized protein n=1 Tax=Sulfobacillus harzensis TaxID=2729629 RepID=A0A7Y0L8R1_9FIRM|nr:hypothetical protein [Sulfobacillus harzensis]NMP24896.1 hypothetical protein [Sulfobacillus harzensis]